MQPLGRFSSDRERRLWLLTVAAVTAIFSTLGVARPVVEALQERNLFRLSIIAVLAMLLVPVTWRWVRRRPDWAEVGAMFGVVFAFWMVWVRMTGWAERTHLIEHGVVAAVLHMALLERASDTAAGYLGVVTGGILIGVLQRLVGAGQFRRLARRHTPR